MKTAMAIAGLMVVGAVHAGSTGVLADGPDSYLIMRTGKTGFVSSSSLQKKAYEDAAAYCQARALVMQSVSMEAQASRPLGGFPEATLRFRCVPPRPSGAAGQQAASSAADRYSQLEQAKRLLDSGALTQAEFEKEKARILGHQD